MPTDSTSRNGKPSSPQPDNQRSSTQDQDEQVNEQVEKLLQDLELEAPLTLDLSLSVEELGDRFSQLLQAKLKAAGWTPEWARMMEEHPELDEEEDEDD
jgi:hypothetical protein